MATTEDEDDSFHERTVPKHATTWTCWREHDFTPKSPLCRPASHGLNRACSTCIHEANKALHIRHVVPLSLPHRTTKVKSASRLLMQDIEAVLHEEMD